MKFRIYNGNVPEEEIEAPTHDDAVGVFLERHPEERRNSLVVRMVR